MCVGGGPETWNPTAGQCQAAGDRVSDSRLQDSKNTRIFVIRMHSFYVLTICQAQYMLSTWYSLTPGIISLPRRLGSMITPLSGSETEVQQGQ